MRRRTPPSGSLVSLLDVLFILVFASLVQSHARGAAAKAEAEPAPEAPPAPIVPAPPAPLADVRTAAVAAVARHVEGAPLIVARIDAAGVLTELETAAEKRAPAVPLLQPVAEEIRVVYHGDRTPAMQVCGVIARELRRADLAGHVIAIAPAVPQRERNTALHAGLVRDVERCMRDQHAMAVIVEPTAPEAPIP